MVQKPETDSPKLRPANGGHGGHIGPMPPPPPHMPGFPPPPQQGQQMGYPGMCTLPRGLPRHQMTPFEPQMMMMERSPSADPESRPDADKPPRPDRPPELQGSKQQRDRFWSDNTMTRNTIVHTDPTEKEFSTKQPPAEWPKDQQQQSEAAMNYTPFKTLPRPQPTKPDPNDGQNEGRMSPRKEQQQKQGFGNVEANEFVPAHILPKPGPIAGEVKEFPTPVPTVSESVPRSRVPSRSSSMYSGISIYNTRRMSENSLQQPVMFQPIAPANMPWPNNMPWGRQNAYPGDLVYTPYNRAQSSAEAGDVGQIPRLHSRATSEMGMREKSAFVAATLPRKPLNGNVPQFQPPRPPVNQMEQQQMMQAQQNQMMYQQQQMQQQQGGQQNGFHRYQEQQQQPQQQRNVGYDKGANGHGPRQHPDAQFKGEKMVAMPVEPSLMLRREPASATLSRPSSQDKLGRDMRLVNGNPMGNPDGYQDPNNNNSTTDKGKGKEPLVPQFNPADHPSQKKAQKKQQLGDGRNDDGAIPPRWAMVFRLALVQVLLGVLLFALGITRLVTLATWGLGIELVFGVLVTLTGVLGILAVQKVHYCSFVAHFVISTMSTCLAIPPFVAALMVTVPDSFTQIDESARKFFTSDNGLIAVDIIVAVLCLIVALVSAIISGLGCNIAGDFLRDRQERPSSFVPRPEAMGPMEQTVEFRKY